MLKVISKALLDRPGALERFQQEIRSAAKLQHPNIVAAYSVLRPGELLVFAMEYVKGQDLSQVVKGRGYLPVANAAFYIHQVALGLQHAHEKGMVHRDIKPNNLMLAIEGKKHTVKILDFGLAKASSEKGAESGLTKSGQMLGTPDYVAPEQTLDAHEADMLARIDPTHPSLIGSMRRLLVECERKPAMEDSGVIWSDGKPLEKVSEAVWDLGRHAAPLAGEREHLSARSRSRTAPESSHSRVGPTRRRREPR